MWNLEMEVEKLGESLEMYVVDVLKESWQQKLVGLTFR